MKSEKVTVMTGCCNNKYVISKMNEYNAVSVNSQSFFYRIKY